MPPNPLPTIDHLLNLLPDSPSDVLIHLHRQDHLASGQDSHGYSLLHAATSYGHLSLMRDLVRDFNVKVDIVDEDGETPLFFAESLEVARCLVEELGADPNWKNADGLSAERKIEGEGEFPLVSSYLRGRIASASEAGVTSNGPDSDLPNNDESSAANGGLLADSLAALPPGVRIHLQTMEHGTEIDSQTPDPEFRRRIEELAARDDFQSEECQQQLKELVKDAVSDLADASRDRNVRRRS